MREGESEITFERQKDRRLEDDRERDMRERIEFGLFGDMAAVTFDNGENVQIGQNVVQEKFD